MDYPHKPYISIYLKPNKRNGLSVPINPPNQRFVYLSSFFLVHTRTDSKLSTSLLQLERCSRLHFFISCHVFSSGDSTWATFHFCEFLAEAVAYENHRAILIFDSHGRVNSSATDLPLLLCWNKNVATLIRKWSRKGTEINIAVLQISRRGIAELLYSIN